MYNYKKMKLKKCETCGVIKPMHGNQKTCNTCLYSHLFSAPYHKWEVTLSKKTLNRAENVFEEELIVLEVEAPDAYTAKKHVWNLPEATEEHIITKLTKICGEE